METIDRERSDIDRLLEESPSLRGDVARMIVEEGPRAARLTARLLLGYRERTKALPPPTYTENEVLGDWFPGGSSSGEIPLPTRGERAEPG